MGRFYSHAFRRAVAAVILSVLIFGALMTRMAKIQLTDSVVSKTTYGDLAFQLSARTYTEYAGRGKIFDRNGVPLVTNIYTYSLVLDYYNWDKSAQNDNILTICGILDDAGVEYYDSLAISKDVPYTYLASSSDYDALASYCADRKWTMPDNAADLLELMADRYGVPSEWELPLKRTVCGVRYEMERSLFSSIAPFTMAEGLGAETVSVLAEQSTLIPGVTIKVSYTRHYETEYAAHILGRVGKIYKEDYDRLKLEGYSISDVVGNSGAERAFESYLRARNGQKTVIVNGDGQVVDEYYETEPQAGQDVYLTIDIKMQEIAEKALERTINEIRERGEREQTSGADAEGGAVVVIDVNTGEILAIASYPTYDLSKFSQNYGAMLEDVLKPMFNRATMGLYAPGSTFKMVTALAGLEEGIITSSTQITDEGVYMYYAPSYTPGCWIWNTYHRTHGSITVAEALKYSCNYFFYEVGRLLGIETINDYASSLGLGQKTGLEIGEYSGNLTGPEYREATGGAVWHESETIQVAIGQADELFTPVQLANYVATLVNGGRHYQAHLLRQTVSSVTGELVASPFVKTINVLQVSEDSIETIKEGMLGVTTEDGTASSVFSEYPIKVGGKTGSAQINNHSANGVFVSFAPYDSPQIAVCVVGEYAGSGGNVAPICREIYNYYFGLTDEE